MFSNPEKIINQIGNDWSSVKVAADFGAGSGAYTIAIAKKLENNGKIYAIEIQKELITHIKNLSVSEGLSNIEVIWGDIERTGASKIADHSVDFAVVANVLFQAENKNNLIKEVKRTLKHRGFVLVVDWTDSFGGLGPEQGSVISGKEAQALFEKEGFSFDKKIDAGINHYGFLVKNE